MPIVIGVFGTITKGLLKGLEDLEVGGRVETIQTAAMLRKARILRRVLETCGDLLSLKLQEKPSANTDVKNPKGVNNNNDNGGLGSWWTGRDYPNDSIAEKGQNPETIPGDLRRLAVTQTPGKKHTKF